LTQLFLLQSIWNDDPEEEDGDNKGENEEITQILYSNLQTLPGSIFNNLNNSSNAGATLKSHLKKEILSTYKYSSNAAKSVIDVFKQIVMMTTTNLR
jgi:hypothetical protein